MNNRETILNELKAISEFVATIPPVTPYDIPAGYFQHFEKHLVQQLKEAISTTELSVPRELPYTVPVNYFENFSANLMQRIRASASTSVTEETNILSPVLNKVDKKSPFTAPAGYFEDLADNLVSGLKAVDFVNEELENNTSLNELKNRPVYTVPTGYFQSLPHQILTRIKGRTSGKVVKMNTGKRIWQFAAAAISAAVILVTVLFISERNEEASPLAQSTSIDSSIRNNISGLSDEAIINYVQNEDLSMGESTSVGVMSAEIDDEDVRLLLDDISDEALSQYVALHTDSKEVNTN